MKYFMSSIAIGFMIEVFDVLQQIEIEFNTFNSVLTYDWQIV